MTVETAVANLLIALGVDIKQGSLEVHFNNRRYESVVVKQHFARKSDQSATIARAAHAAAPVRRSDPDSSRAPL